MPSQRRRPWIRCSRSSSNDPRDITAPIETEDRDADLIVEDRNFLLCYATCPIYMHQ